MTREWFLFAVALVVGWFCGYVQARKTAPRIPVHLPEPGEMPEVESLVRERRKVDAVKAYRERTGAGLADAKAVIDGLERRLRA